MGSDQCSLILFPISVVPHPVFRKWFDPFIQHFGGLIERLRFANRDTARSGIIIVAAAGGQGEQNG